MLVRGFVVVVFVRQPCVHSLTVEVCTCEAHTAEHHGYERKLFWLSMHLRDCGNHITIHLSAHLSALQLVLKSHMALP